MEPSMRRMAEDNVLDTTIREPSMTAGELADLFREAVDGLVGEDPPQ
jgi:hypothetical protein